MDNKEIVKGVKAGDREAMEVLYTAFGPRMMRVIRRYIPQKDVAQDLLHDSFIVIFTRIGDVRNADKLEFWMATIVKNLCLNYLSELDVTTLLNEELFEIEDVPDLEELLSFSEIESLVNKLPEGYRNVFRLAVFENKSHKEIGRILGIAPHSSSSQLTHAKAMLRRMIVERKRELGLATVLLFILFGGIFLSVRTLRSPLLSQVETASETKTISTPRRLPVSQPKTSTPLAQLPATPGAVSAPKALSLPVQPVSPSLPSLLAEAEPTGQHESTNGTKPEDGVASTEPTEETTDKPATDKPVITGTPVTGKPAPQTPVASRGKQTVTVKPVIARAGRNSSWAVGPQLGFGTVMKLGAENALYGDAFPGLSGGTTTLPSISYPVHFTGIENDIPLDFGLSVSKHLAGPLSIETGLTYSYLHGNITYARSMPSVKAQRSVKWNYLGIPLNLNVNFWGNDRVSFYGSAGVSVHFPIATVFSDEVLTGKNPVIPALPSSKVQFSGKAGLGVQLNVSKHVGLYAEPSVRFNFDNHSEIENYWQEHKTMISLPLGLRFQW